MSQAAAQAAQAAQVVLVLRLLAPRGAVPGVQQPVRTRVAPVRAEKFLAAAQPRAQAVRPPVARAERARAAAEQ